MKSIIFILLSAVVYSCSNISNQSPSPISKKDSIMKEYFSAIDSLSFYDTLDEKFLLLKAYYLNDTTYLLNSLNQASDFLKFKNAQSKDTSLRPKDLKSIKCEAAYQFEYAAAFCDKTINITISKSHDTVLSEIFLYQTDSAYSNGRLINHQIKQLSKEDWKSLSNEIFISDFWGMQIRNDHRGLDGSSLTIIGYESPINAFKGRLKYIYRWAAEKTAIGKTFKTALDISNVNIECFHYN